MSIRDPERWQRAQDLFLSAAEQPADERDAWVARACAEDAPMLRAVRRLLDADRRGGAFIEQAIADGLVATGLTAGGNETGLRIGRYRLLRQIGHGGMGVVYLAERADQAFEKRVALKLLAPGLADETRRHRFHAERQILARLEHPGIAHLLDGGTTGDGRPYLVMEYVEGEPIDRYCQRHGTGLRARLRLFRDVCEAVEHAHQNLIVHRDLKPENILVTPEGAIKLLDFGIAKLLAPNGEARASTVTETGLMTPQYASPEQVRGEAVTTASDIYALGLILYRLLTDARPYEVTGTAPGELARIVCEVEASPPSIVARKRPADERPVAPSRLVGDLDAIVMKALRKEQGMRYRSVALFSGDLDCFFADRPVSARRGSLGYRLHAFARRHRLGLAASVAMVALAAGFTVRVVAERDRAEQAVALLADLIAFAEPAGSERRARTADQQRFAARTDTLVSSLEGLPQLQGRLLASIGGLYHVLGLDQAARPRLEQALAVRRALGDDPAVASSLDSLGELRRDDGDYAPAETLLREALAMRRRLFGDQDLRTAESLDNLAHVLYQGGGDAAEAGRLYREALAIRRRLLGDQHLLVAESRNNLALALQALGDTAGAERELTRAAAAYRQQLGDDDPDVAMVEANLGILLTETGRPGAGEEHLRAALAIDRRHYGDQHSFVAQDHDSLAWAMQKQGAYSDAEREYRAALATRRQLHGDEHPDTLASINNLASLFLDTNRFAEAVAPLRQALDGYRRLHDADHPSVVQAAINLALALEGNGAGEEAESLLRQALASRRRAAGDHSLLTADAEGWLGALWAAHGRIREAEPLLRQALGTARSDPGADPRLTARLLHALGNLLRTSGRAAEAQPLVREALRIRTRTLGPGDWHTADTAAVLGLCLAELGENAEAAALLASAYPQLAKAGRVREARAARQRLATLSPAH